MKWLQGLLSQQKEIKIGFYGEVNAGKTTLANRFSKDFTGKEMGVVSPIPHETREIVELENVEFNMNGKKLQLTLVDLPGIATEVDYKKFMQYDLTKEEAIERAKEATKGIILALRYLKNIDLAIVVMDATKVPFEQVNLTIIGSLQMQKVPTIIAANKIDLENANPDLIKETFPDLPVVPISALHGTNIEKLYQKISEVA